MRLRTVARILATALLAAGPSATQVPEPEGFRGEPYRAPVPETLAGAHVINDAAARALWLTGRVAFVDVLPQAPRPGALPPGTLWIDRPNRTIPGAIWLPDTGYAALSPGEAAYLAEGLATATDGALDAPVVIFCRADCWMSWNAARRAVAAGYSRVFWYPRGTDGWQENGWPLAPATPHPRAPDPRGPLPQGPRAPWRPPGRPPAVLPSRPSLSGRPRRRRHRSSGSGRRPRAG